MFPRLRAQTTFVEEAKYFGKSSETFFSQKTNVSAKKKTVMCVCKRVNIQDKNVFAT